MKFNPKILKVKGTMDTNTANKVGSALGYSLAMLIIAGAIRLSGLNHVVLALLN